METIPFGRTGHQSTRVIFGAAALWRMNQEKADEVLDILLEYGINHIDTAALFFRPAGYLEGTWRGDAGTTVIAGGRADYFGDIKAWSFDPRMTARQQLEMVLRWGGGLSGAAARRRTDEMLSLLGLARKAHLRPGELSGGEKQRVAIGRALAKNPMFCFADEPTSALDWANGEQVIELLRAAAHERGATILVVAHDARIIPYADRVFIMEDGFLKESDPDEFGRKPDDAP